MCQSKHDFCNSQKCFLFWTLYFSPLERSWWGWRRAVSRLARCHLWHHWHHIIVGMFVVIVFFGIIVVAIFVTIVIIFTIVIVTMMATILIIVIIVIFLVIIIILDPFLPDEWATSKWNLLFQAFIKKHSQNLHPNHYYLQVIAIKKLSNGVLVFSNLL